MASKKKMKNAEFMVYINDWYEYLYLLCLNRFEWINLPDFIDPSFIERTLMEQGKGLFFYEEIMQEFAFTKVNAIGKYDFYGYPTIRKAFAINGYTHEYNRNNSVLIYNNRNASSELTMIMKYAYNLANIEYNLQMNIKQQKFPFIVLADPQDEKSMISIVDDFEGGKPFIYGRKGLDIENAIKILEMQSPYIANQLHTELHMTLNDAYVRLGIESSNTDKNERLVTSEVSSNLGGTESQRYVGLNTRRYACKLIKKIWNLDLEVNYQSNLNTIATPSEIQYDKLGGEDNEQQNINDLRNSE